MTNRGRMKKLYPGLTALERGLLVLHAWKQGTEADPQVRHTLPAYQINDFNRYIDLMNGANQHLGPFIVLVKTLIDQASIRFGWLCTLRLWTIDSQRMGFAAFQAVREPITESEYQERQQEARTEEIPVDELAEYLAERELTGDVTDADWKRAAADKATTIQQAIDSGAVAAHRRSRRILVEAGSFYDWLGGPVPVYPEWGYEFDVRPDGEDITPLKQRFDGMRKALQESPAGIDLPPRFRAKNLEGMARFGDEVTAKLEDALRSSLAMRWRETYSIDVVLAEVIEEFAGEDPLLPALRAALDDARATLDDLRESMGEFGIEVDLPEPGDDLVAHVRRLVHRDLNDLTLTLR